MEQKWARLLSPVLLRITSNQKKRMPEPRRQIQWGMYLERYLICLRQRMSKTKSFGIPGMFYEDTCFIVVDTIRPSLCRSMSLPTVSPVLSSKSTPHGRARGLSPLSPLSPTRPNIGMVTTSPPRVPDASASSSQPPNNNIAGQTSSTPKTTAQDLLNNVMGVGRPANKADAKSAFPPHFTHKQAFHSPTRHHQRLSSSSQPQTLFTGAAGPSIWSAAPDESALGLSPRHRPNGTLPGSPLMGLAPATVGHASPQTTVPMSSAPHASVHSGVPTNMFPPATASAQVLWPPYDRTEEILPTHTTHIAPTCP